MKQDFVTEKIGQVRGTSGEFGVVMVYGKAAFEPDLVMEVV